MDTETLVSWALIVMRTLQPAAPYEATFEASARVLVKVAEEAPLYPRDQDGVRRTVALDLSIGNFEGALRQDAEGDCDEKKPDGTCKKGSRPHSFCMFQIGESNFRALKITREQIQTDFEVCTRAAHTMIRISFGVCRSKADDDDRLAHYAHGGATCAGEKGEGLLESRHRMKKAKWIFGNARFLADVELAR